MSRKMLITLIVLMAVVLSGLILVQASMIKSASDIREEQFNRQIKNVLAWVARQLDREEELEARRYIKEGRIPGAEKHMEGIDPVFPRNGMKGLLEFQLAYSESSILGKANENDSSNVSRFASVEVLISDREQQRRRAQYVNDTKWTSVKQIYLEVRPIEERIDTTRLSALLSEAMEQTEIHLEYKYAVTNANTGPEEVLVGQSDYHIGKRGKEFNQPLFQNDFWGAKANYLNIYFPHRKKYLLKQTGLTIMPTIVLTGLLIGIFVYAIMVIFRQKKLSNIKNDFINNMTHELKTPISTISLASQMLQDGSVTNTPTMIAHVSKVINQESKRLGFQVEKVLQMAVFNEGRLKLKLREFDVNKMVETVSGNFELRVNNKNGILKTEILAENASIKGDEVHITNVIFNLLDNAMKYSTDNPEITVSTRNKKDAVVVTVQDNGIGIPKEHQANIFDRFYRVPTGNVHDVKGFGLGLSYVKKIIDLHEGTIKVESTLNKGTKFKLYFPQINN